MKPYKYVKSAITAFDRDDSRLSEEFEGKDGDEIVDIVSEKSTLEE